MTGIDAGTLLTAFGMVVGVVVWLVRLEGRINLNDARWQDMKDDIAEIKTNVKTLVNGRR